MQAKSQKHFLLKRRVEATNDLDEKVQIFYLPLINIYTGVVKFKPNKQYLMRQSKCFDCRANPQITTRKWFAFENAQLKPQYQIAKILARVETNLMVNNQLL